MEQNCKFKKVLKKSLIQNTSMVFYSLMGFEYWNDKLYLWFSDNLPPFMLVLLINFTLNSSKVYDFLIYKITNNIIE